MGNSTYTYLTAFIEIKQLLVDEMVFDFSQCIKCSKIFKESDDKFCSIDGTQLVEQLRLEKKNPNQIYDFDELINEIMIDRSLPCYEDDDFETTWIFSNMYEMYKPLSNSTHRSNGRFDFVELENKEEIEKFKKAFSKYLPIIRKAYKVPIKIKFGLIEWSEW